jgi:hypothetical protein
MKRLNRRIAALCAVAIALISATPASADEHRAVVRFSSNFDGTLNVVVEYNWLPAANAARGADRVDLEALVVSTDFKGLDAGAVIAVLDGDSTLVKSWQIKPNLRLTGQALSASTDLIANVGNGSLVLRFANGSTVPLLGIGAQQTSLGAAQPGPCAVVRMSVDLHTQRATAFACAQK